MACFVRDLIELIDRLAPPSLAESWDRVGLQLGNAQQEVKSVLIALDPTQECVQFAGDEGFDLLITHHPLFFHPLYSLDSNGPLGSLIETALKNKISIFSAHTNLDSARDGINDLLAGMFQLQQTKPLVPSSLQQDCGLGRIGTLLHPLPFTEFVSQCKKIFAIQKLRFVGNPLQNIRKVAVCSGSGRDLIKQARLQQADCYVTGDLHYHDALTASEEGPALIDPGHFALEFPIVAHLAKHVEREASQHGWKLRVQSFERVKDPFQFL